VTLKHMSVGYSMCDVSRILYMNKWDTGKQDEHGAVGSASDSLSRNAYQS